MKHRLLLTLFCAIAARAADTPASALSSKIVAIASEANAPVAAVAEMPAAAPVELSPEAVEIARLERLPPQLIPVQDDTLANAISTIATSAGMNYIGPASDEFPERVTLNAKLNPWRLLTNLADRYRFTTQFRDGLWVFNREAVGALVAKKYYLKNANLDVYKTSQNSFSSVGQITNVSGGGGGQASEGGMVFTAQVQKIIDDIRELIGLPSTRIASEGKMPEDDEKRPVQGRASESVAGGKSGPKVLYLPDTNAIYVACTRDQHLLVEDYIKMIDVEPKQIEIMAYFWETTDNPRTVLGINPENFQPNVSLSSIKASVDPLSRFTVRGDQAVLSMSDVSLQMNALRSDKRSRLLQNPTVNTSNNREVYFSVGDEEPFVSSNNIYPGVATGGFGATTANVSIRRIGTSINIVPTIFPGEKGRPKIRLVVRIEVGALKSFRQVNSINIPVVSSQKYEYQTYVTDNQVLAFGGLSGIGETDGVTKVPIAGDVPIVGYLFKSKSREVQQRNLVAYIVARVVENPVEVQLPKIPLRDPNADSKSVFPK